MSRTKKKIIVCYTDEEFMKALKDKGELLTLVFDDREIWRRKKRMFKIDLY